MNKKIFPIILLMVIFFACSKEDKTRKEAEEQLPKTLSEWVNDPTSMKTSDIQTMYSNDSLTILHTNVVAKNGFGNEVTNRIEYIFLKTNGETYDAVKPLDEDSIYQDEETWAKKRKDEIYEKLDYGNAVAYRAISYINAVGRNINDKFEEKTVNLPVPTNTGRWELQATTDKFGDKTDNKYLSLIGNGEFSNSATSNSKLSAIIFVLKNTICIRLLEYGSHTAKDDDAPYKVRIKDGNGKEYPLMLFYNDGAEGNLYPLDLSEDSKNTLKDILSKEGEITFSISYDKYTPSSYRFKVNADGYNEAIKHI